jgi:hypothetical protein
MGELVFDPEKHLYTLDGQDLPSVTQILTATGFINTQFYDAWSRDKGSMVHLVCHLDDTGELDEESLDQILIPYLDAYRQFKEHTGFIASASEVPLASERYRFAGTPDKIGSFKDGECCLIDIKSGNAEPWAALQTALYVVLKDSPYKRYVLKLTGEGKYKLIPFNDRQDRQIALSAVSCYWWQKNNLRGKR